MENQHRGFLCFPSNETIRVLENSSAKLSNFPEKTEEEAFCWSCGCCTVSKLYSLFNPSFSVGDAFVLLYCVCEYCVLLSYFNVFFIMDLHRVLQIILLFPLFSVAQGLAAHTEAILVTKVNDVPSKCLVILTLK